MKALQLLSIVLLIACCSCDQVQTFAGTPKDSPRTVLEKSILLDGSSPEAFRASVDRLDSLVGPHPIFGTITDRMERLNQGHLIYYHCFSKERNSTRMFNTVEFRKHCHGRSIVDLEDQKLTEMRERTRQLELEQAYQEIEAKQ